MRERPPLWDLLRDIAITALGFFILVHQTTVGPPRVELIAAALALLGVPWILRLREKERNGEE